MRAAVYHRVAEAACGVGIADLGRLGRIILDVLTSEGVDLRRGCSLDEMKDLVQLAALAAQSKKSSLHDEKRRTRFHSARHRARRF